MRILIIEDNPDLRSILQKRLTEESYVVETAVDGEDGLHKAMSNVYDIIILDLQLPKKDGLQVCQELRAAGRDVRILILSVQSDVETKADLLNMGADDYLAKPFSFKELTARLHALLRRPKKISNEILRYWDIEMNVQKHTVRVDDRNLYLTRKEFMLLELFLKNPEAVLTRQVMAEHVWDSNLDPFSNTIESHILMLRKKIETPGSAKRIHTIVGRGYMLSERSPGA
ncbi:response regulator [Candidatus Uhrbacteria bacterium]|nr:response regulator [Candidatus Uhrbacteria bacterium]MBD3284287.1 response regulator [Candidatus Uhrbacteria bacterium]